MKWRHHKKLAHGLAKHYPLDRDVLVRASSSEPDDDREQYESHRWDKKKGVAKRLMFRAREHFLRDEIKECSSSLGHCCHFIADGLIHNSIPKGVSGEGHVRREEGLARYLKFENDQGAHERGTSFNDGKSLFKAVKKELRNDYSDERLNHILILLCAAVTNTKHAPEELVALKNALVEKIKGSRMHLVGAIHGVLLVLGLFFGSMTSLFLIPYIALASKRLDVFRFVKRYMGWSLLIFWFGIAESGYSLFLFAACAVTAAYLFFFKDRTKESENWFIFP